MKNLKRILSLALASTMLIGMMVVGASAADFTDADKISNVEAAETMDALGIIKGYPQADGTLEFAPEGKLNRAQMATMIARILNKGTDPSWAVKETPTFVDVAKGSWYEAAIEYCYNLGVINGYGNGYVGPNDDLTATQAARMILNAMGYTYSGDWQLETEIQARDEDIDLYNGLDDLVPGDIVNRDTAAQMLYNALYADMAEGNTYPSTTTQNVPAYQVVLVAGQAGDSLPAGKADELKAMWFDSAAEAVVVATSYGLQNGVDFNVVQGLQPKTVATNKTENLGHKYLGLDPFEALLSSVVYNGSTKKYVTTIGGNAYNLDNDYSALIGQNVEVLRAGNKIYGVVATGTVVYTGFYGDLTPVTATTWYAGSEKLTMGTYSTVNFNTTTGASPKAEYPVKVMDNDNDGKVDLIVVTPVELNKVANISSTRITLVNRESLTAASLQTNKEIKGYEGIAAGDFVAVVPAANTISGLVELTKVTETVEGTITAVKAGTNEIQIDGAWYEQAEKSMASSIDVVSTGLGKPVTLVFLNGYFAYAELGSTVSKDLIILTQVANEVDKTTLHDSLEATALFVKDGTVATIKIDKVNATGGTDSSDTVNIAAKTDVKADSLYTYKVSADGFYTVTKATIGNTGYEGSVTANADLKGSSVGTTLLADNAIVVVKYGTAGKEKYEILDGKTVKGWKYNTSPATIKAVAEVAGFTDTVGNVAYIQVAVLTTSDTTLPGAAGVADNYGYVTSIPYQYTDSTGTFYVYTMWNGTDEVTVYDDPQGGTPGLGDMITYTDKGNGRIESDEIAGLTEYAVSGYASSDNFVYLTTNQTKGTGYTIDDKTAFFYINSYDIEGADSGVITNAIAIQDNTGATIGYYNNVMAVIDGTNHVKFLVVDNYGNLGTTTTLASGEPLYDDITFAISSAAAKASTAANPYRVDASGALKLGSGVTVKSASGTVMYIVSSELALLNANGADESTEVAVLDLDLKDIVPAGGAYKVTKTPTNASQAMAPSNRTLGDNTHLLIIVGNAGAKIEIEYTDANSATKTMVLQVYPW